MATVYKAHDPSFDREVAIKVLPREFLHDPQFRVRFEREIKTVAQLEHPAIVPVYDVGEDDGVPFFVMRNMTGGSLSDWLKQGAFSMEDTARIVERMCKGLAYAHKKGVVHRDLKPGNVLFDNNGEAFISDFGVAKLADAAHNVTGSGVIGTPAYMSPEQAQSGQVDARSDVYAMGAIIYEMLTGQQPYRADTPMGVVIKHITDPVPEIRREHPDLPIEVDQLIKKAMSKIPDERYPNMLELAKALNKIAFGTEGVLTDSQLTRPRTEASVAAAAVTKDGGKPSKKNLVWIGAGVGALVLLAVAFLLLRAPAAGPVAEASPTSTVEAVSAVASPTAAEAAAPPPTFTLTAPPPTQTPQVKVPDGAADKIAFVSANEIWAMNPDGSEAAALTSDGSAKARLQWLPDRKTLLYVQNTCLYSLDVSLGQPQKITCLQAERVDGFSVSPDGTRAAISVDLQLVIVPFDMTALGLAQNRGDLVKMEGACLYNRDSVKDMRWSRDGKRLAVIYLDVTNRPVDQFRVMDVSNCPSAQPSIQGSYPGQQFIVAGFQNNAIFPSFDWNGDDLIVFNDVIRNEGFGNLYYFNTTTGQGGIFNPIENTCCYRDARFSPDGKFLLFAFQDIRQGAQAVIHLVYAPLDNLLSGRAAPPLSLPLGVFSDPRSAPQPALRPFVPPPSP
jgi:predicted Ser/Thr protein kinase